MVDPLQVGFPPPVMEIVTVAGAEEFTVMVIALLVAVLGTAHTELAVSTQEINADEGSVVLLNVGLLPPEFTPFTFH
jgi:hypothetical protein